MAKVVYGSEIAAAIKNDLKQRMDWLHAEGKRLPRLVVILVGADPASISYVRGKEKACQMIGMENELVHLPETTKEEELLALIASYNKNTDVDGILVQLPLPTHINEHNILLAIDPRKDVDGFHPYNIGRMMLGEEIFLPCTPMGIMEVLKRVGYEDLSGKQAVVIGRSNIVGKPIAQLLLKANATVTMTHSKTKDIEKITAQADVLIAAVGKPRLIGSEWVKEGAVVIDVGVNRDENNRLCGDVDFEAVKEKASIITPVPKGIGPMTIAMLLQNTWNAYLMHEQEV